MDERNLSRGKAGCDLIVISGETHRDTLCGDEYFFN